MQAIYRCNIGNLYRSYRQINQLCKQSRDSGFQTLGVMSVALHRCNNLSQTRSQSTEDFGQFSMSVVSLAGTTGDAGEYCFQITARAGASQQTRANGRAWHITFGCFSPILIVYSLYCVFPSCIPLVIYSPCCLFPSLSIPLITYSTHYVFPSLCIPLIVYSPHCIFPSLCIPLIVYSPHYVFPSLYIPFVHCGLYQLVRASFVGSFLFFWCGKVRICYF